MTGLLQSLNTARRALWASRMGLDVAAHNIANVNTPGYSRQRMNLAAGTPLTLAEGQLGTGVEIMSVERIRNNLLDVQFRQANQSFGANDLKYNIYAQMETIIMEPSDSGIGSLMTEFFNEFSQLGSEPENMADRNSLLQKSDNLALSFRTKHQSLTELQSSLTSEVETTVNQVNLISREIADLNQKIIQTNSSIGSANDMKDRRDNLLDQMSSFVNMSYSEDSRGSVTVSIEGQVVVSDLAYRDLGVNKSVESGRMVVSLEGSTGREVNITGGSVGGLLEMHNVKIPGAIDQLNSMAGTFMEEVNRIHKFGFGLPVGDPPESATGLDFFTGADASNIRVSSDVSKNAANIAASIDGSAGNGDIAFALSNLRDQTFFNNGSQTLNDYYNSMVAGMGTDIQLVNTSRQNQEQLALQVENQREAVSGVSLDEEMTSLIQFQRSLEAASKIVSVVDEVLQTVINM